MLVAAIDELATDTGDVIGNLLSLPELSGQWLLTRRHHLDGEHVHLGWVMLVQVLRHRVLLVEQSSTFPNTQSIRSTYTPNTIPWA